jgi:hypothetical protein
MPVRVYFLPLVNMESQRTRTRQRAFRLYPPSLPTAEHFQAGVSKCVCLQIQLQSGAGHLTLEATH